MQLFSADATMFFKFFFDHKKLKKTPPKVAQKYSNLFSPIARSIQTAQTEEFIFQNVAYRATVYTHIELGLCTAK